MPRLTNLAIYVFAGNGYIEGKELQNFIKELQQARKQAGLVSNIILLVSNVLLDLGTVIHGYRPKTVFVAY